jgi:hypothetical protein
METRLVTIFKDRFIQRKDFGLEYFMGDIDDMRLIIMGEVANEMSEVKTRADKYALLKNIKEREINKVNNVEPENVEYYEQDNLVQLTETVDDPNNNRKEMMNNEIDNCIDIGKLTIKKKDSDKENILEFIKYVYDVRPEWYTEKHYVDIKVIMNAYNRLFQTKMNPTVISKYLQGKMFHIGYRSNNVTIKKLVSFRELEKFIS